MVDLLSASASKIVIDSSKKLSVFRVDSDVAEINESFSIVAAV